MNALAALPALIGPSALTANSTLKFINLALGVVVRGIAVAQRLDALNDQVQLFVEQGRNPTDAEWQDMELRIEAVGDDLRDAVNEQIGNA